MYAVEIPCNGPTCAIFLYAGSSNSPLERLAYEGTVFDSGETDIGVFEDGNGSSNFSLQRRIGNTTWLASRPNTFGAANVVLRKYKATRVGAK